MVGFTDQYNPHNNENDQDKFWQVEKLRKSHACHYAKNSRNRGLQINIDSGNGWGKMANGQDVK